jgi:ATP-binding cassette subfamily B protein
MRKYLDVLRPDRSLLIGALIVLLLTEIFPFLYPLILSRLLDGTALQGDQKMLVQLVLLYALCVFGHSGFLYLRFLFGQRLSIRTTHDLRCRLFAHLQKLPLKYFQRTPVGNMMTRLTSDVDAFGALFNDGFLELFSNVVLLVFSVAFMLWQNWFLGLATISILPLIMLTSTLYRSRFRVLQKQLRTELANLNSYLQESINGVSIIQAFRRIPLFQQRFAVRNNLYIDTSKKYAKRYAGFFPIVQSLSDFSLLACYCAGIWLISKGNVSAGTMAAFAWYASIYSRPLRDISDRINTIQNALVAGDRVLDLLQETEEEQGSSRIQLAPNANSIAVRFHNVHFAYHQDRPVLQGIHFEVLKGSTVALVGATGCGKSTILQLLLRFMEANEGGIEVFGVPLREIDSASFHSHVAWLGQDPFLFPGTIQENICLGRAYDANNFESVCKRAQIAVMLENLPAGAETRVGTGGQELSTGQRQLVSYARTLYQDPEILLLDEPSASIDAKTEQQLHLALRELLQGRTAILVTHRVASVAACDHVLVLGQGKIIASGTPSAIIQQGTHYQELFAPRQTQLHNL